MKKETYKLLYTTEETYWWFVGQRLLLQRMVRKYAPKKSEAKSEIKLVDLGCGTGKNIQVLSEFGDAEGIDVADEAIAFCTKKGVKVTKSNVMDMKLPDSTYDVVTELGVFYHEAVTDDLKAMKEAYRILKPGGIFFVFDCAMMCLFGKHDVAFHGARRYSRKELKTKLEQAGFIVERISYINTLLFPLVYIKRKLEKLSSKQPESEVQDTINPMLNKLLTMMYKGEIWLNRHITYPCGINIYAVARKK